MGPIIPLELIREKARRAFATGKRRDEHDFNWHACDAIDVWQAEWDRCMRKRRERLEQES